MNPTAPNATPSPKRNLRALPGLTPVRIRRALECGASAPLWGSRVVPSGRHGLAPGLCIASDRLAPGAAPAQGQACRIRCRRVLTAILFAAASAWHPASNAQTNAPPGEQAPSGFPFPGGPPMGVDGPFGFGPPGMGGPNRQKIELLPEFDRDRDGWLNQAERAAAREHLRGQTTTRGAGGRPGWGFPFDTGTATEPAPGPRLTPADVALYPDAPLYDRTIIRTLFLEFENPDWEQELEGFRNTDVEVPATVTVDGAVYPMVGVHFRGNTSYMMVQRGRKRPLNLQFDFVDAKQRLYGYRNLNLLNAANDASFLRLPLGIDIAQQYFPAPHANFVRVVINGESWGLYVNMQQFDKEFTTEWFGTGRGARWKVPGSPNGQGTLAYLGDDLEPYRRIYEIKSKEDLRSWVSLIVLCRTLTETPPDRLETALAPMLDIDAALRFLALENVLCNSDGYWTRASDYSIYLDPNGVFHILPYDFNEVMSTGHGPGGPGGPGGGRRGRPPPGFGGPEMMPNLPDMPPAAGRPDFPFSPPGPTAEQGTSQPPGRFPFGPGGGPPGGMPGGGPMGGGVDLDPLVAAENPNRPLIARLLAVPALRTRYLQYVHQIAEHWLDWDILGPRIAAYTALIDADIQADTRKLDSYEAFRTEVAGTSDTEGLRGFVTRRRAFLLAHPEVQRAAQTPPQIPPVKTE